MVHIFVGIPYGTLGVSLKKAREKRREARLKRSAEKCLKSRFTREESPNFLGLGASKQALHNEGTGRGFGRDAGAGYLGLATREGFDRDA